MQSETRPLGEFVTLISGNTPSKANPAYWGGTTPWVSAKDMGDFWIDDAEDHLTEAGAEAASRLVPAGTVLLLVRGMTLHKRVPICRVARPSTFNQDVKAVLPKNGLSPRFLPYLLVGNHDRLHERVDSAGHGTGRLNTDALLSLPVYVPSKSEQEEVADLGEAIDERLRLLRQTNTTLESIAQALFKSWFIDFDPVRAKAEGREPEGMDAATAAQFPAEFEESALGLIPRGWTVRPFAETIETLGGGTPKTSVPEYWGGDVPWFSVVDTPGGGQIFTTETEKSITMQGVENSSTRILPKWTTIISARGTVGKLALTGVEMAMNQSCYGLKSKIPGGETITYLAAQRLVEDLKRLAHGGVFDTITRDTLSSVHVCDPPPGMVKAFNTLTRPLFERILTNGLQARRLSDIRDALLPRLISGKVLLPESAQEIDEEFA